MASITMTAPFLGGSAAAVSRNPDGRRRIVMVKASKTTEAETAAAPIFNNASGNKDQSSSAAGRRDLVFAVAAATAFSVARVAMADDEPKPGTSEAKKKYAPVCVTMPTARICRK